MNILLMGNPNVGKSVVFNRLTGARVVTANYAGTTVEYTKGFMFHEGKRLDIIDVPGTYTLEPTCKAEEVAVDMMAAGDLIINVANATNLERNLRFTLELMDQGKPMVLVLNLWDETRHKGIYIDVEALERLLGIPVIPTVAVTAEGIKNLISRLPEATVSRPCPQCSDGDFWQQVGMIIKQVQRVTHRHHTWLERLEDVSIKPLTGLPLAAIVIFLTFFFIRLIGENLISHVFDPFFETYYRPFIYQVVNYAFPSGFIHNLLLGTSPDFVESLGLLTTGIYVPIAMVLPYIFSFYLILSFLEDFGYLPRFAILIDTFMHKIGLHGFAIIPMILGLGCNVPGAMATRVLESRREKFIAGTLMAISVPCMAQTAMIIGLVGRYGLSYVAIIYGTLALVALVMGSLMNALIPGYSPEIFLEIPSYHIPHLGTLLKKLWMRIRGFLAEAIPLVLVGVLLVNILFLSGVIDGLASLTAPVIVKIMGLPKEAVSSLIIGFLRKDVAIGMLEPLGMSIKQLIIASTILSIYFPCIATFAVLMRELGIKAMLLASVIMVGTAVTVGGILNLVLPNFS
ncbi:MAG: ferrous iron transporter B [Deltaproteobacteria bacterium]|nr:ferrous iron transporter B [Candidatus Anaeroferrophillus wilburensis]MBN2888184.1 ferrous iron transporter B [Deltaproteobacteria bacterium]